MSLTDLIAPSGCKDSLSVKDGVWRLRNAAETTMRMPLVGQRLADRQRV